VSVAPGCDSYRGTADPGGSRTDPDAADAYLADLVAEVGEPSPRERARAQAIARRIRERAASRVV